MKAIQELNDKALRGINGGAQNLRDLDLGEMGEGQEKEVGSEKVGPLRPTTRIFPD